MHRQSRHHQLVKQASQGVFNNQKQNQNQNQVYPNINNPQNNSQNPRLQQNRALIQKQQQQRQQQPQQQVPPPTNTDPNSQSQISIPTAITHLSYRIMKVETTLRDQKTDSSSESADVVALVSDQMDELLVRVENLENGDAVSTGNRSMKTLAPLPPPPPPIDMSVEIKKHMLPYMAKITKENKLLRGKIEEIESNLSIFQSMYSDLESRINVMYNMDEDMDVDVDMNEIADIEIDNNDINDINDDANINHNTSVESTELENDTIMSAITTGTPAPEEDKNENNGSTEINEIK
jgi:hypothetical protein